MINIEITLLNLFLIWYCIGIIGIARIIHKLENKTWLISSEWIEYHNIVGKYSFLKKNILTIVITLTFGLIGPLCFIKEISIRSKRNS